MALGLDVDAFFPGDTPLPRSLRPQGIAWTSSRSIADSSAARRRPRGRAAQLVDLLVRATRPPPRSCASWRPVFGRPRRRGSGTGSSSGSQLADEAGHPRRPRAARRASQLSPGSACPSAATSRRSAGGGPPRSARRARRSRRRHGPAAPRRHAIALSSRGRSRHDRLAAPAVQPAPRRSRPSSCRSARPSGRERLAEVRGSWPTAQRPPRVLLRHQRRAAAPQRRRTRTPAQRARRRARPNASHAYCAGLQREDLGARVDDLERAQRRERRARRPRLLRCRARSARAHDPRARRAVSASP